VPRVVHTFAKYGGCTRGKPKVSGLGQCKSYGRVVLFEVAQSLPRLEASLQVPFPDAVQHRLLVSFHFRDTLQSWSLKLDFHLWV
jgi:hypothetical protein